MATWTVYIVYLDTQKNSPEKPDGLNIHTNNSTKQNIQIVK